MVRSGGRDRVAVFAIGSARSDIGGFGGLAPGREQRPMAIEDALATWLGNQRWFAGKGQGLYDLAIVADTELVSGDPELRHLIVAVSHGTAVDYYQVLVGLRRRLPARLKHARIGPWAVAQPGAAESRTTRCTTPT